MTTTNYVPTEEDLEVGASIKTYRIANGKIRYGAGNGDEVLDNIVGLPVRVGVAEAWTTQAGVDVPEKLRIQFKKPNGELFQISARTGGGVATRLAMLINEWEDGYIRITPQLGSKANKYGKIPTFVNAEVCMGPGRWSRLDADWPAGADMETAWDIAHNALQSLPIYKDFVREDSDGEDEWDARDELTAFAKANNLAEPFVFTKEWEAALTKLTKKAFTFAEQTPEEMQKLVAKLGKAGREKIEAAGVPEATKPAPSDDYDPFADD